MKANLPKKTAQAARGGPYNDHSLLLSVGMIVKNEEKNLGKCLRALKPLLDAVPSELIITDTGSTDRTVEIAEQYADRILRFEWCGDFSAARNTGLKEARGEWFMFLDADEWFEDVTEIVDFFKSGEYRNYGGASFIIRNYLDPDGSSYADYHALRMVHCYPGMRFEGIIHESVAWMKPLKLFEAYAHHYGYVYSTREDRTKKLARNMELLEEGLAEHPDDLKMCYQLGMQLLTSQQPDRAAEICAKGLKLEPGNPNRVWKLALTDILLHAYLAQGESKKVLDTLESFLQSNPKPEIIFLDYYFIAQAASFSLKNYEKATEFGKSYMELYQDYRAGRLDCTFLVYADLTHLEPGELEKVLSLQGRACALLEDREKAVSCMEALNLSLPGEERTGAFLLSLLLADHFEDWSLCADFYRRLLDLGDPEKAKAWVAGAEEYFRQHPETRAAAMRPLASLEGDENYTLLCRLRVAEEDGNREEALACLGVLTERAGEWDANFADALYYLLKEQADLLPVFGNLPADKLGVLAVSALNEHGDFAELVSAYFQVRSLPGLKGLYWKVSLMESAVIQAMRKTSREEYLPLLEEYARESARYARSVYREEIFSGPEFDILPGAHRFGIHMEDAFAAHALGDGVAYLANLRKALGAYPAMKGPIRLLMERFHAEDDQKRKKAEEFSALAAQAKAQVEALLAQESFEAAGQVVNQLLALLPNDPELTRMQEKVRAGRKA